MAEQAGAPPPSPPKVTKAESPASLLSSSPPSQLFQPSSLQSAPLSSSLQLSLLSKAPLSPVLPSPSKAFEPIAATSKAGATGMGTSHLARKCNDDVNNAKHDEIKAGLSVKPPYNSAAIGKGSGASSSTNCDRTVKCDGAGASSTAKISNIKTACLKGGSEGDSSPLPTLSTAMVGAGAELSLSRYTEWMPSLQKSKPSRECIRRVRNDIRTLMRDPVSGLFVYPDEDLVSVVHALVTGPFDTPYEGGFFYFLLHCPDDYPHNPPRVRLMTTGGGAVRFNPNLYANGKVCLSILGTWSGPRWTPVQSIFSVLLSIQSLMSEKPYHNEPGFEVARNPQDVRDYSDCITHETLRVAVCSMVEDSSVWRSMPECFQGLTRDLFLSFIPRYELVCEQNIHRDGERMIDPFGQNMGTFQFGAIQRCIAKIARMLEAPPVPPAAATAETAAGTTERERDDLKPSCRETPVAASANGVDCTVAPDGEMASQCFEGDGEKGLSECSVSDAKDAKGRGS